MLGYRQEGDELRQVGAELVGAETYMADGMAQLSRCIAVQHGVGMTIDGPDLRNMAPGISMSINAGLSSVEWWRWFSRVRPPRNGMKVHPFQMPRLAKWLGTWRPNRQLARLKGVVQ